MGFTLIGPWNCPCKAIVLPHIGITWGLHWSTHETAHINHRLTTHWYYMRFTLVGPWNCTWQATVFHTLALHGVYIGRLMKLPIKTLSCHILVLHGSLLVSPRSCPCKTTVLPIIGIAWGSHWLAHETAHVKPLFWQTLALHGLHIVGPWNCPCITTL